MQIRSWCSAAWIPPVTSQSPQHSLSHPPEPGLRLYDPALPSPPASPPASALGFPTLALNQWISIFPLQTSQDHQVRWTPRVCLISHVHLAASLLPSFEPHGPHPPWSPVLLQWVTIWSQAEMGLKPGSATHCCVTWHINLTSLNFSFTICEMKIITYILLLQ